MMGEEKGKIQALREWVVEHKLRTVGTLWASGILGSMAYNWSQPNMKTRVKIIHARHASTFFTLFFNSHLEFVATTRFLFPFFCEFCCLIVVYDVVIICAYIVSWYCDDYNAIRLFLEDIY